MEAGNNKRTTHRDSFIKATNVQTGAVKFYRNGREASIGIGCSHVQVYKALMKKCASVHGWTFEYISTGDPQCADFKKEVEVRIQSQRRMVIDAIKNRASERKQLIQDAKKLRKAEHDEIVGTLNAAMETIRG